MVFISFQDDLFISNFDLSKLQVVPLKKINSLVSACQIYMLSQSHLSTYCINFTEELSRNGLYGNLKSPQCDSIHSLPVC